MNHAQQAKWLMKDATTSLKNGGPTTSAIQAQFAQTHATLELAEQMRISNLIALADMHNPRAETQISADARSALTVYRSHENEDMGGRTELSPDIATALKIGEPQ